MTGEISKFLGFNKSAVNPEYQNFLADKAKSVFGDKKNITLDELFDKDTSVFNAYKKLDANGKAKFNDIISLDGDSKTINSAEYKTLISVLDSEELGKNAPMLMDYDISVNDKNNGIYTLGINEDIAPQYKKLKSQSMSKNEILQEVKQEVNKVLLAGSQNKSGTVNTKSVSDDNIAKALLIIYGYSNCVSVQELLQECLPTIENKCADSEGLPDYAPARSRSDARYLLDGERVIDIESFGASEIAVTDSAATKVFKRSEGTEIYLHKIISEDKNGVVEYVDENGDGYADKKISYDKNGEEKVENYPDINEEKQKIGDDAVAWRLKVGSRVMHNILGYQRGEDGKPKEICY